VPELDVEQELDSEWELDVVPELDVEWELDAVVLLGADPEPEIFLYV
jgi:hypothetical protein